MSAALKAQNNTMAYTDGSHSSVNSKRHMTVRLEFAKWQLKDSQTMTNNIPMVKHGCGDIMLWGVFSVFVKLVKIEGKMNRAN